MKFAVDVHGVIADKPALWQAITEALQMVGHEVHILSGPPREQIEKELRQFGIGAWTHIFSIVDYHKEIGTPMKQDSRGNWHLAPLGGEEVGHILWDRSKGDYCFKHQIDVIFDDSDAYKYFVKSPTAYCRFYSMDKRSYHTNPDTIEP